MKVSYKNISIFYEDAGQGSPVVLLHGFLENASMWDSLKSILEINYRVITIDLLGHGKTGCLGYVHTMEMMAEAVQAVLEHLHVENATFIGHSMGGYVALAFAELFPPQVQRLALVTSTPSADSKERRMNRDRAIEAVKTNPGSFIRIAVENLFNPATKTQFANEIAHTKQQALKTSTQGILAALEGMKIRKDRTQILVGFERPKAILAGSEDQVITFQAIEKLSKTNDIPLFEVYGGHMLHIENSAAHNNFIEKFVDN